jgi:hypothetical protein
MQTRKSAGNLRPMPRLAVLALAGLAAFAPNVVAQTTTSESTSREPVITTLATTRTVTQQQVTSVTASKSVKIEVQGGTTRTSTSDGGSSGDSGIPAWGWVLIGAGAVALVAGAFALGRRGKQQPPEPGAPT